jgi:hypothetical protein
VDDVKLRETFGTPACGVDVMATKVASPIEGFLERKIGKILVPKYDHFSLSS